jgi:hypothetical protein
VASKNDPAPPRNPEPPAALKRLAETLKDPRVANTGLTTNSEGEWALLLRLYDLADAPIAEIESQSGGAPVIYAPTGKRPAARPAYPAKGE